MTKRKTRTKTKRKTKAKSRTSRKAAARQTSAAKTIGLSASGKVGMEMQGESLTVKLSRNLHPEVFDIDRMVKQIRRMREAYQGKRKMRDFCEFLAETEKSLEIMLSNHLEDALRKYLR